MKLLQGFEICMIGVANVWDSSGIQVERMTYSGNEMVYFIMDRDKMTEDEALDYVQNVIESEDYGIDAPIIVWEISFTSEQ